MSLFGRLYDILRVNLQTGSDSRSGADGDPANGANGAGWHTETSEDSRLAEYYANLEIPYGSDLEAVRNAWKRQMKKYHPDLHGEDAGKRQIANELSAELTTAYRALEQALKSQERGNIDV